MSSTRVNPERECDIVSEDTGISYCKYGRRRTSRAIHPSRLAPVYPIERKIPVEENGETAPVKNIPFTSGACMRYPTFAIESDPANPRNQSTSILLSKENMP